MVASGGRQGPEPPEWPVVTFGGLYCSSWYIKIPWGPPRLQARRRRNAPPRETTMGVAVVGDVIGREICIMKTTLQASELATCRRTLKKHRHPLRRPETFTLLIIGRTQRMAHTIKHAHERSRLIAGCQSSIQLDSSKCIFYPTRRSTPNKTKRIPLLNLRQRLSSNS